MYTRNNNIRQNQNMYYTYRNNYRPGDDRFFGGGILAPLLVGGIAGYAIGNNNGYNNNCCPQPMYFVPAPQPYPVNYPVNYPVYTSTSNTNNYY